MLKLSVEELLAGVASVAGPETDAVLLTVVPDAAGATATVSVTTEVAPTASVVFRVQVTTWPAALHNHPVPVPETKVRFEGRVSVMTIGCGETFVPLLVTLSV